MGNDPRYNQNYWKANRKRLLKIRNERYRTDKAFRLAAIARSRAATALARVVKIRKQPMVTHNGVVERRHSFADLCTAANRSKDVLYRWQDIGVLPKASYTNARGYRYYSESQLKFVGDLVNRIDNENYFIIYPMMGNVLRRVWNKTYSKDLLTEELVKEMGGEEENRDAFDSIGDSKRSGDAKEGKGKTVRRRTSYCSGKHGNNTKHGELSKSSFRGRPGSPLCTC